MSEIHLAIAETELKHLHEEHQKALIKLRDLETKIKNKEEFIRYLKKGE